MTAVAPLGAASTAPDTARTQGLVVIAASAGGLNALTRVLSALPENFAAPVVVVQHLHRELPSMLAEILDRRCAIGIREAADGEHLAAGTVYVAARDRHVLVNTNGTLSLTMTPLVHFVRPSADVLFESAAASYGRHVIAVVLTGAGIDGAAGVQAVKRGEGLVIVQDEATSQSFGMPSAAIGTHDVDRILPLGEIAPALIASIGELES